MNENQSHYRSVRSPKTSQILKNRDSSPEEDQMVIVNDEGLINNVSPAYESSSDLDQSSMLNGIDIPPPMSFAHRELPDQTYR